ncbi:hypothetical protein OS493_021652 [Desmophyllum pertusum]|uniref:Major facilitator superfamily (MFS) profile domain-containing protein n=1 Tax=Desmophyllum pertusum TaxID=174260 RepID=A0A9W9YAY6_9CNID|nr:hypothetical protein OS493_021652 [Desmophyllum pertusum]
MIKRLQHRPDSPCSWFACICASVCYALNLGFCLSFGVMLPELMEEFNEGRQKTVWVGSLTIALAYFLCPLGSFLSQTIGCRLATILGGVICAVGLLLASFSSSLLWMFVTYSSLYGLGASIIYMTSFVITAKNFVKWKSLAVGIVSVGGSVGILALGPLLQLLNDMVGWRGTYRIMSLAFSVVCACGATFGDPIRDQSAEELDNPVETLSTMDTSEMADLDNTAMPTMDTSEVKDLDNTALPTMDTSLVKDLDSTALPTMDNFFSKIFGQHSNADNGHF